MGARREPPARSLSTRLAERTVVLSGGLTGAGEAMARAFCDAGANVVVLARPRTGGRPSRPRLELVDGAAGRGAVVRADVRDEDAVEAAVALTVAEFGGVDVCVNSTSVLSLTGTAETTVGAFDLLVDLNLRAAFLLTRACLPHLRASTHAHVLTIAPPLRLTPTLLGGHPPYTVTKFALTMLALGWSVELAADGVASNCLWPERAIGTDAVVALLGDDAQRWARDPQVLADAACAVVANPPGERTGQCLLDGDVLRDLGPQDPAAYGGVAAGPDLFVGG